MDSWFSINYTARVIAQERVRTHEPRTIAIPESTQQRGITRLRREIRHIVSMLL